MVDSTQPGERCAGGISGGKLPSIAATGQAAAQSPLTIYKLRVNPELSWGGARNRKDRVSTHLTAQQCEMLIAAAEIAERKGLAFNRSWTVHYERAGIADKNGARFIRHLLKLLGDFSRRHGGKFAAVWVREGGEGKGGHVHILMHLARELSLRGKTKRWIEIAGGVCRKKVSVIHSIGGRLAEAQHMTEHYHANRQVVRNYILKYASPEAGIELGLPRYGEGGAIIGKRCGRTQNLGPIQAGKQRAKKSAGR